MISSLHTKTVARTPYTTARNSSSNTLISSVSKLQETQLSLTNRATQLCNTQWRGWLT